MGSLPVLVQFAFAMLNTSASELATTGRKCLVLAMFVVVGVIDFMGESFFVISA